MFGENSCPAIDAKTFDYQLKALCVFDYDMFYLETITSMIILEMRLDETVSGRWPPL